ncbi:hypothetical protein, partial [Yersinia enterocolitica]|uniref:hypothetical protein n=1 Tax=Yersinia enterocolitica TaxID=630 RepID=UPI003CFF95DB
RKVRRFFGGRSVNPIQFTTYREALMKIAEVLGLKAAQEMALKIAYSLLAEGVDRTLVKELTGLRDEDLMQ